MKRKLIAITYNTEHRCIEWDINFENVRKFVGADLLKASIVSAWELIEKHCDPATVEREHE